MKTLTPQALSAVLILLVGGCSKTQHCINASNKQTEQIRSINNFHSVEINVPADVILKQNNSTSSVKISAADNILPYLQTKVKKNVLSIALDKDVCNSGKISVIINGSQFKEIRANGKLTIHSQGQLKGKELILRLNGANTVSLHLATDKLTTISNGTNTLLLTGVVKQHSANITGEGIITDNTAK